MADYSNIPDTAIDPDAPLTSELAYAWRDNPIAIAEGAIGAPKVVSRAIRIGAVGGIDALDVNGISKVLISATAWFQGDGISSSNGNVSYQTTNDWANWSSAVNVVSASGLSAGARPANLIVDVSSFSGIRLVSSGSGSGPAGGSGFILAIEGS